MKLSYGTAGFRGPLDIVRDYVEPVTCFLLVKSVQTQGTGWGLQFTASHNPSTDHGMKICDDHGHILSKNDEALVGKYVNLFMEDATGDMLAEQMIHDMQNNYEENTPKILIGFDHRPGTNELIDIVCVSSKMWARRLGFQTPIITILSGKGTTTPEHHWMVNHQNDNVNTYEKEAKKLWENMKSEFHWVLDVAHGVGTVHYHLYKDLFEVDILNENKDPKQLNHLCGADDVHKTGLSPMGVPFRYFQNSNQTIGVSFDGDADRILFWVPRTYDLPIYRQRFPIRLFDGDRIMSLWAAAIQKLIIQANFPFDWNRMILAHTAYSNGGAIDYWGRKGFHHAYGATGVKNLHPIAEKADIGIYFETNGHGTILYREELLERLNEHELVTILDNENTPTRQLKRILCLGNPYAGDAIRDWMITAICLDVLQYTVDDWYSMYEETPNLKGKFVGADRNKMRVEQEDRLIVEPAGLHEKLQGVMEGGRFIIRPSGTEDMIRLYLEHPNEKKLPELMNQVQQLLHKELIN